jgi:hypothetical protein
MQKDPRYPTLDPEILEGVLETLRAYHFDLCAKGVGSNDYSRMKADNVHAAITEIEQARKLNAALKVFTDAA